MNNVADTLTDEFIVFGDPFAHFFLPEHPLVNDHIYNPLPLIADN
jgi:hypothetical protein